MPPPWLSPRAAYIHVPFCAHHCGYCDFAIAVNKEALVDRYLDALAAELATLGQPTPVDTLFIGGGTPTYLSTQQLDRLLRDVTHWLPLGSSPSCAESALARSLTGQEFSVEANPGTLDADKIDVLADRGVNRISLGAQSFQPRLLSVLERDHGPADVPRAVARLRRRIDNISLDLIFGTPGQTLAEWQADLSEVLALEPEHLSTYGLTYEKGTPLWKRWQRGTVTRLSEEVERELYAAAMDTLETAGFEHYELSNFCRPGRRCRHNEAYWANHAYFGFGMGAARYVNGRRELNTRDLNGYMNKVLAGQSPAFQSETLSPEERARETLMSGLRRCEGIERAGFREQTGFDLDALIGPALAWHVDLGFLHDDTTRVWLSRAGKFVADSVIVGLL
jgi:oxygen-independent coproporphyrinogen-3 oxidase